MGFETPPEPSILLADEIQSIRLVLGNEIPAVEILQALTAAGNNTDRAINFLLDSPRPSSKSEVVKEKNAFCVTQPELNALKEESVTNDELQFRSKLMMEKADIQHCSEPVTVDMGNRIKNGESVMDSFKDRSLVKMEKPEMRLEKDGGSMVKKEESMDFDHNEGPHERKETSEESCDNFSMLTTAHYSPYLNTRPIRAIPPKFPPKPIGPVSSRSRQVVSNPDPSEMGEFPEEPAWFLVGRSYVMGLATARGWGKLEANEIVYFNFPKISDGKLNRRRLFSSKAAAATSEIVRFSTKRSGEVQNGAFFIILSLMKC